MNTGLDLGYSATKIVWGLGKQSSFPSVVGTPDRARFSINGAGGDIVLETGGATWLVGQGAIEQSRFVDRREDRLWIESDAYYRLFLAAMTEATGATTVDLTVVTGLPVAFYSDKDRVRDRLLGEHRATREGRRAGQIFRVKDCRVIPQPFGALLAVALDNQGRVIDQDLATGAVGVIDVGGKTTNLLSVNRMSEIGRETASVNVGAWDVVRAVREFLTEQCPNLELRDHQVIEAIIAGRVRYYGDPVDLADVVEQAVEPLAAQVIAEATQLWNGGAGLDAILISGGGALLLGGHVKRHFRHARVTSDPIFANARGFWKFAQRLG